MFVCCLFCVFCSKICCVFAVDGSCAASFQAPSDQHVSHPGEGCPVSFCMDALQLIIIIMYIYHALINTLSSHIIHVNLNTIFYTYVEDSPTKSIYIRHYMEKHMHAHTHTHTNTRTHARTRTQTHTHTHTRTQRL